ncbi:MAG: sugar ABC transporter permease [Bacilli bacterium]|nr:sugar ABC transporter permease [Bacilli bacterium]
MAIAALIIFIVFFLIFAVFFAIDYNRRKNSNRKYHKNEVIVALLLLIPAVVLAFFFVVLPIIFSFGYAFTDYDLLSPNDIKFVWFDNFRMLFKEFANQGEIFLSFRNTALFVVLVVPLQITMALLLALFCNNKRRGTTIFKVCFFAPVAVSLSVTAFLWLVILSPNPAGIMNSILKNFGIPAQDFLGNKNTVILWMVIISAWQGCGYQMLIFLSALGNIRKDLYEAASIDGAGPFRKFFTVTVPGLRPTMLYILITVFIGACRVLIQPMLLTGYQDRSMTLSYYMYQQGFTYRHVGYSCAVALVLTIVIGSITFLQRKLLGEKKK